MQYPCGVKLVVTVAALVAALWVIARLWPALRAEPATWLGEDWSHQVREKLAV
jgi:hypothetical protein